jgi:hypothetical protein
VRGGPGSNRNGRYARPDALEVGVASLGPIALDREAARRVLEPQRGGRQREKVASEKDQAWA